MIHFGKKIIIKLIYMGIDGLIIFLSIYTACLLREETLPFAVTIDNLLNEFVNPYRFAFILLFLTTILINNTNGLYQTKREIIESLEIWQVVKSVSFSCLVTIVALYLLKIQDFPRSILILVVLFVAFSFSMWRIFKRLFVTYLVRQGYNNFNALIIGAGKVGHALASEMSRKPELGIRVVGFLDDFKTNESLKHPPKILGKISDFVIVARREFINKIFITIHHDSQVFLQLLQDARDMGIAVQVVPQGFDLMTSDFYKYNIGFIPILEYCEIRNFRKQAGKRLFDFMISLFLTLCCLPFFIILGLLIKCDSPGPIFYKSRRYGYGGRIFRMYKFLSMSKDADHILEKIKHKNEVDGPIFKIKDDPRITKIGRFLRRYSLDELPQLFNVLTGDMSLVGPRPLPIDQIEKEDLSQLKRLEVRPGITGLWQIRGRSDLSFSRLIKWDIWYINNWSFWLDLNILFQTIPVVFKAKGAY